MKNEPIFNARIRHNELCITFVVVVVCVFFFLTNKDLVPWSHYIPFLLHAFYLENDVFFYDKKTHQCEYGCVFTKISTNLRWKSIEINSVLVCVFNFCLYAGKFFVVVNKKKQILFYLWVFFFNEKDKTETPLSLFSSLSIVFVVVQNGIRHKKSNIQIGTSITWIIIRK